MTRWGLVATIKAAPDDVLNFAAYHLEQGAHRLYLYLDVPEPELAARLATHPKVRVIQCDDIWWARRGGRPDPHQHRQVRNAHHAYHRRIEVDWLGHIDVDEFLCAASPIADQLAALPPECLCAQMRPVEALAGDATLFKALHQDHSERERSSRALFPRYGAYLNGGFLSHVAGKLFYRTGIDGLRARIHNILVHGQKNPGKHVLSGIELAHVHARSWEDWSAQFTYRHAHGSYRAELPGRGPVPLHSLLGGILAADGMAGLRAFFDEVATARTDLVRGLEQEGLLRRYDLDLAGCRQRHFPNPPDADRP